MTIEKVLYKKTFNLGNYSTHTIGIEIGLDAGEDAKEAIKTASDLCHEYHKESTDGLDHACIEERIIRVENNTLTKTSVELLQDDINSCKELKVLESYKFLVKQHPQLQETYDNKLKQLK